jgi:hypothetical protein
MRRTWATLLLVLFSFSLIGPAVFAGSGSQVPQCCSRLGNHHCLMTASVGQQEASGSDIKNIGGKCPYYPLGRAVPAHGKTPLLSSARTIFAFVMTRSAARERTEARYRISFDFSHQKRGPPTFFS